MIWAAFGVAFTAVLLLSAIVVFRAAVRVRPEGPLERTNAMLLKALGQSHERVMGMTSHGQDRMRLENEKVSAEAAQTLAATQLADARNRYAASVGLNGRGAPRAPKPEADEAGRATRFSDTDNPVD